LEFPQGGERLVGLANIRAMREAYPAHVATDIQRIRGGGALWVTEVRITYDGTKSMHAVNIMEFRDGKVAHETIYFGDPGSRRPGAPSGSNRWPRSPRDSALAIEY